MSVKTKAASENFPKSVLEIIPEFKQAVLSELKQCGLSDVEIDNIINGWSDSIASAGSAQTRGQMLPGLAAGLHQYQFLANAVSENKSQEEVDKALAELGYVLTGLVIVGIGYEGMSARAMAAFSHGLERLISERSKDAAYSQAKKDIASKASASRSKKSEEARKDILRAFEDLREENPKITKARATEIIFQDNTKNKGLSQETIRKILRTSKG